MDLHAIDVGSSAPVDIDPTPRARNWLRALHSLHPWLGYQTLLAYNWTLKALRREWSARTCFGAVVQCRLEDVVQKSIFHFGVWEPEITEIVRERLRPGDTFIDLGANVGYYTLLGARLIGPRGRVVGIEPSPSLFELLQVNLARNDVRNVRLVQKAVAPEPGEIALFRGSKGNVGTTTTRPRVELELEARVAADTLMAILERRETQSARLAKIDVEGAEIAILRDVLAHLEAFSPQFEIIVEIDPSNVGEANELFREFVERGFTVLEVPNAYNTRDFLAGHPLEPLGVVDLPLEHGGDFLLARTAGRNGGGQGVNCAPRAAWTSNS
jgi:FkbM family methyltransferase